MKQQSLVSLFCVLVAICVMVSCTKERSATHENGTQTAGLKAGKEKPFVPIKGVYLTTNDLLAPPPMLKQRITGIGESSHLGEGRFVAVSTMNQTTPPPFQLGGTCVFYAANGDTFTSTFTGTATPGPGRITVIVDHIITGGTGRFESATGSFTGTSIVNPANSVNSITYEGVISY